MKSGQNETSDRGAGMIKVTPEFLRSRLTSERLPFLDPYTYADGSRFFGRSRLRAGVERKLRELQYSVLVIHGASGSGKSSLINAALVPELVALGYQVGVEVSLKRRTKDPSLCEAAWKSFGGSPSAIIIDQFEELYTLYERRAVAGFFQAIERCSDHILFVLAVRREFYSDVDGDLTAAGLSFDSVHVPLLTVDEASEVLTKQADLVGRTYEDGLVRRVVSDLSSEVVTRDPWAKELIDPPQLQIVVDAIYRTIEQDPGRPTTITHSLYELVGTAEGVLQRFIRDRIESYTIKQKTVAQAVLKKMLTAVSTKRPLGESDRSDLHRVYGKSNVVGVLRNLVNDRLIRPVQVSQTGSAIHEYELAHDYLAEVVASWVDSNEKRIRMLSAHIEKYYPLLDLRRDTSPLSKQQFASYFEELMAEAERNPSWVDLVSTAAFVVLMSAALLVGKPEHSRWLVERLDLVDTSLGVDLVPVIAAHGDGVDLLHEIDPISWMAPGDLTRCIALNLLRGSSSHRYWYDPAGSNQALERAVAELGQAESRAGAANEGGLTTRLAMLRGILAEEWPQSSEVLDTRVGTALDELRVFEDVAFVAREARALRHAFLRRCVHVPAGDFLFGAARTMANIDEDFSIGITPVTNGQYREFVFAGGYTNEELLSRHWSDEGRRWLESSGVVGPDLRFWMNRSFNSADQPVVGVCLHEARAYADFVGGRLPTEFEWERAARGTDGRVYPWGDQLSDDRCLLVADAETMTPIEVGRFPRGASPYGVLDMCGNVWEWTNTISESPRHYILRGGSLQLNQGVGQTYSRSHREAHDRYSFRGFRVVW